MKLNELKIGETVVAESNESEIFKKGWESFVKDFEALVKKHAKSPMQLSFDGSPRSQRLLQQVVEPTLEQWGENAK